MSNVEMLKTWLAGLFRMGLYTWSKRIDISFTGRGDKSPNMSVCQRKVIGRITGALEISYVSDVVNSQSNRCFFDEIAGFRLSGTGKIVESHETSRRTNCKI